MPAPYSLDLRTRIIAALEAGQPVAQVAARFAVAPRTVRRYRQRWQQEGMLIPRRSPGRARRILPEQEAMLIAQVEADPDATLATHCRHWQAQTGITLSPATMCRALQRLALTRKKSGSSPASRILPSANAGGS